MQCDAHQDADKFPYDPKPQLAMPLRHRLDQFCRTKGYETR